MPRIVHPPVFQPPQPKPFQYTFRMAQYRITDTRARHNDTDVVGYTLGFGGHSYTQTLPPADVNNGNHDIGLEFPGLTFSDPAATVTLSYAITNAGHDSADVEAAFKKGVDLLFGGSGGKNGSGDGSGNGKSGDGGMTGTHPRSIGGSLLMLAIDEALQLLFANCDGAVAADQIELPLSEIDALFPQGACVSTVTRNYPGTTSPSGCLGNSNYYVTQTITRTRVGDASHPVAGRPFIVANRSSGLVLDIPGSAHTPGVAIQQWSDNGSASQHWELQPVDAGYCLIRSAFDGLVLEVAGDSHADHAQIHQALPTGKHNQHWMFEAVPVAPPQTELPIFTPVPYYRIRSRSSGKVLDVPSLSADPGIKLQQFTAHTNTLGNQLWQLLQVPSVPSGPVNAPPVAVAHESAV